MPEAPILVIGGGIAGQAVCEALRDRDPRVPITLLCGEPRLPYAAGALAALSGEATVRPPARPEEWYADRHIDVRLGTRAARSGPDAGTCESTTATTLAFGRAVLCTGSDALVLLIPEPACGAFTSSRPGGCVAIATAARRSKHAVVIGGGRSGSSPRAASRGPLRDDRRAPHGPPVPRQSVAGRATGSAPSWSAPTSKVERTVARKSPIWIADGRTGESTRGAPPGGRSKVCGGVPGAGGARSGGGLYRKRTLAAILMGNHY